MSKTQDHSISRKLTWMNMWSAARLSCWRVRPSSPIHGHFPGDHGAESFHPGSDHGSNTASALLFTIRSRRKYFVSFEGCSQHPFRRDLHSRWPAFRFLLSRCSRPDLCAAFHPSGQTEIHWLKDKEIVLAAPWCLKESQPGQCISIRRGGTESAPYTICRHCRHCLVGVPDGSASVSSIFRRAVADPIVRLAEVAGVVSATRIIPSVQLRPAVAANWLS